MSQQVERNGRVFTYRDLDAEGLTPKEKRAATRAIAGNISYPLPNTDVIGHQPDWAESETPEGYRLNALGDPEAYDDSKALAAVAPHERPVYPPEQLKGVHEEVIGKLATEGSLIEGK